MPRRHIWSCRSCQKLGLDLDILKWIWVEFDNKGKAAAVTCAGDALPNLFVFSRQGEIRALSCLLFSCGYQGQIQSNVKTYNLFIYADKLLLKLHLCNLMNGASVFELIAGKELITSSRSLQRCNLEIRMGWGHTLNIKINFFYTANRVLHTVVVTCINNVLLKSKFCTFLIIFGVFAQVVFQWFSEALQK